MSMVIDYCSFVPRRHLYQSVYEYDLPLLYTEPQQFEFIQPQPDTNSWRDSFKLLVSHADKRLIKWICRFVSGLLSDTFRLYITTVCIIMHALYRSYRMPIGVKEVLHFLSYIFHTSLKLFSFEGIQIHYFWQAATAVSI